MMTIILRKFRSLVFRADPGNLNNNYDNNLVDHDGDVDDDDDYIEEVYRL